MKVIDFVTLGCIAVVTVGCVAGATTSSNTSPGEAEKSLTRSVSTEHQQPAAPAAAPPVDLTIEAVSLSAPSRDAAEVMAACGVTTAYPKRLAAVSGMGKITHAKDATKYTYLSRSEPEIATDEPAWVIQLAGKIDFGEYWALNPVCVFVNGQARFFAPDQHGTGDEVENPEMPNRPSLSLPPPLP